MRGRHAAVCAWDDRTSDRLRYAGHLRLRFEGFCLVGRLRRGTSIVSRRVSQLLVALPPFGWIALFLFAPYCILLCYSYWSLGSFQQIVHHWSITNYIHLFTAP